MTMKLRGYIVNYVWKSIFWYMSRVLMVAYYMAITPWCLNRWWSVYKFGKTRLLKYRCHDKIKLPTQQPVILTYCQINFRRKVTKFGSVWMNIEKVIKVQSQRGHFPPPTPVWIRLTNKSLAAAIKHDTNFLSIKQTKLNWKLYKKKL